MRAVRAVRGVLCVRACVLVGNITTSSHQICYFFFTRLRKDEANLTLCLVNYLPESCKFSVIPTRICCQLSVA